jgi:hypothetical protein
MKRLLRSYVYNGFVWELNCSTSGELNDDKSSTLTTLIPRFATREEIWLTLLLVVIATAFNNRSLLVNRQIMPETTSRTAESQSVGIQTRRHNGFEAPYDGLQLVTWAMYPLILSHYYSFLYFLLWNLLSKIVLTVTFSLSALLLLVSVYLTCTTDPADDVLCHGREPNIEAEHIYCYFCELNVHTSSKHCRFCDKCIVHFDHHCQWLNTCIGGKNYAYFIATVTFALVLTAHNAALSVALLVNAFAYPSSMEARVVDQNEIARYLGSRLSIEAIQALTVVSAALFLALIAMIIQLAAFHIMLNVRGLTTYEYIVQTQKRARDREQKKLQKRVEQEQARKQQDMALASSSAQIARSNSAVSASSSSNTNGIGIGNGNENVRLPHGSSSSRSRAGSPRAFQEQLSFHSNVHYSSAEAGEMDAELEIGTLAHTDSVDV